MKAALSKVLFVFLVLVTNYSVTATSFHYNEVRQIKINADDISDPWYISQDDLFLITAAADALIKVGRPEQAVTLVLSALSISCGLNTLKDTALICETYKKKIASYSRQSTFQNLAASCERHLTFNLHNGLYIVMDKDFGIEMAFSEAVKVSQVKKTFAGDLRVDIKGKQTKGLLLKPVAIETQLSGKGLIAFVLHRSGVDGTLNFEDISKSETSHSLEWYRATPNDNSIIHIIKNKNQILVLSFQGGKVKVRLVNHLAYH